MEARDNANEPPRQNTQDEELLQRIADAEQVLHHPHSTVCEAGVCSAVNGKSHRCRASSECWSWTYPTHGAMIAS